MDKETINIFKQLNETKENMFHIIKKNYYANQNIQESDIEHYLDALLSCIGSQESIEFYYQLCNDLSKKNTSSAKFYTKSLKQII